MGNASGKNFALIGAGGYVAPKHMRAIRYVGGNLIAAMDPADSVGILDSFSYDVEFFTEFERFDRHAEKMRRQGEASRIHYVSICSPNYLHDAHMRFALRIGADAICEKPLVLNPWNLDVLEEMEQETGRKVNCILQLRLHPSIIALKQKIDARPSGRKLTVDLSYITSRGRWYFNSWKGNLEKSGGIASNIGIHFFDMLMWIFGVPLHKEVHYSSHKRMAGFIELEKARVRWYLSVDRSDLPQSAIDAGKPAYRSITIDGEELEFSSGFTDLHTQSYQNLLNGNGFGIKEAKPSISLVSELRNAVPVSRENGTVHPLLKNKL